MSETSDQAGADPEQDPTVIDPLDAMMNAPQNGADDFAAYEAERAALLKAVPEEFDPRAEAVEDEQDEGQEFDDAPDEGEEESPADPDESEEPAQEEEGEEPQARKGTFRTRLRRQDDIAIAELARALDIPLLDAAKQFEAAKAGTIGQSGQEQEQQAPPARTYAQARAELAAKIEEQAEAIDAVDFEAQKRLFREIEALRDELPDLKDEEKHAKATAEARESEIRESVYLASEDKAFQFYPGLNDPNSRIYRKMAELYQDAVEMGDPLANDPDRPWILAKQAAKETGTLMTKPNLTAVQKPAAKKQVSPFQPASGNGRTTSTDTASIAKEIDGIDSLEAYERAVGRR